MANPFQGRIVDYRVAEHFGLTGWNATNSLDPPHKQCVSFLSGYRALNRPAFSVNSEFESGRRIGN